MKFEPSGQGMPVQLSSIIEDLPVSCGNDSADSFATVPDRVVPGDLFFALSEESDQVSSDILAALDNGASAAVYDRRCDLSGVDLPDDAVLLPVKNPKETFGRFCQALCGNPAKKMKMIAITGTSGKTSTSYIIAGMLAESGCPVGLIGSLGVYDGRALLPNRQTPPNPFELAQLLAQMVEYDCLYAIVEVSSQSILEERLAGIEFDAVCLTNIRRDHLDFHKTVDLYRRTKMRIFQYAKPSALVVCNPDDRVTSAVLHLIQQPTMTIGLHPSEAMVTGMRVEQTKSEQTFYVIAGSDAIPVRTHIIGNEHIYNCLTAAALGISWGIDLKTVVRGIERVEHIPGRLERIDCGQPFGVFVDNANTPESLGHVLKTLREVTDGTLYCVLSAPADNDRSKRPLMGRVAESFSDRVVVTLGRDEPDSAPGLNDLLQGMENAVCGVQKIFRRPDAIVWALSNASPEDTVLVVGSDPSPEADPEEIVSDRQFVRHWLYENQPCLEPYWF